MDIAVVKALDESLLEHAETFLKGGAYRWSPEQGRILLRTERNHQTQDYSDGIKRDRDTYERQADAVRKLAEACGHPLSDHGVDLGWRANAPGNNNGNAMLTMSAKFAASLCHPIEGKPMAYYLLGAIETARQEKQRAQQQAEEAEKQRQHQAVAANLETARARFGETPLSFHSSNGYVFIGHLAEGMTERLLTRDHGYLRTDQPNTLKVREEIFRRQATANAVLSALEEELTIAQVAQDSRLAVDATRGLLEKSGIAQLYPDGLECVYDADAKRVLITKNAGDSAKFITRKVIGEGLQKLGQSLGSDINVMTVNGIFSVPVTEIMTAAHALNQRQVSVQHIGPEIAMPYLRQQIGYLSRDLEIISHSADYGARQLKILPVLDGAMNAREIAVLEKLSKFASRMADAVTKGWDNDYSIQAVLEVNRGISAGLIQHLEASRDDVARAFHRLEERGASMNLTGNLERFCGSLPGVLDAEADETLSHVKGVTHKAAKWAYHHPQARRILSAIDQTLDSMEQAIGRLPLDKLPLEAVQRFAKGAVTLAVHGAKEQLDRLYGFAGDLMPDTAYARLREEATREAGRYGMFQSAHGVFDQEDVARPGYWDASLPKASLALADQGVIARDARDRRPLVWWSDRDFTVSVTASSREAAKLLEGIFSRSGAGHDGRLKVERDGRELLLYANDSRERNGRSAQNAMVFASKYVERLLDSSAELGFQEKQEAQALQKLASPVRERL